VWSSLETTTTVCCDPAVFPWQQTLNTPRQPQQWQIVHWWTKVNDMQLQCTRVATKRVRHFLQGSAVWLAQSKQHTHCSPKIDNSSRQSHVKLCCQWLVNDWLVQNHARDVNLSSAPVANRGVECFAMREEFLCDFGFNETVWDLNWLQNVQWHFFSSSCFCASLWKQLIHMERRNLIKASCPLLHQKSCTGESFCEVVHS